jgi:hypothetical protein
MAKQTKMSFVEKAGLFFGVVGVLADFTALVSFTYGFANLEQFTPSHVSSDSATSFFKWFSGLIIIYAWFITSWYLTRRTFVLRYEKPRGYKNPLDSRSARTIFGVALFLIPVFIYWSIVNVSFSPIFSVTPLITTTSTPSFESTLPVVEPLSGTPDLKLIETNTANSTPEINAGTPTPTENTPPETLTPIVLAAPSQIAPTNYSEDDARRVGIIFTGALYYILGLPLILFIFGLIIYACINSLMPIVHVELLDDYE